MAHDKDKDLYSIGIDVGGTKILAVLLDSDFKPVSELKTKTKPDKGEGYFLQTIVDSVKSVMKDGKVDRKRIVGIGVGCPGFVNPQTGVVALSPNIPFLKGYSLAKRISEATDLPTTAANDVQTGLYGEHQFGAAVGYRHVIGIFLGTGIGGAIILDGEIYRGSSGSAGEIGHMIIDPIGPACGCGRRGCLESFAGRLAIASEAATAVARQKAPHLAAETGTDIKLIKSGALARSVQAGDRAIEDLIRGKARIVGTAMANLVNALNPEMIVLGGGVVEAMPGLIVREAEDAMREQALSALVKNVKVSAAKLKDYSVVYGAAKRAHDRFGTDHG